MKLKWDNSCERTLPGFISKTPAYLAAGPLSGGKSEGFNPLKSSTFAMIGVNSPSSLQQLGHILETNAALFDQLSLDHGVTLCMVFYTAALCARGQGVDGI